MRDAVRVVHTGHVDTAYRTGACRSEVKVPIWTLAGPNIKVDLTELLTLFATGCSICGSG